MYITNETNQYPCTGYIPSGDTVRYTGVEGVTLPVTGAVTLCADDGFELAKQDTGGFARQTLEDGILTLTNEPEPVPVPAPEPLPQPPSAADMAEAMIDLDTRVSMFEMGVN